MTRHRFLGFFIVKKISNHFFNFTSSAADIHGRPLSVALWLTPSCKLRWKEESRDMTGIVTAVYFQALDRHN